jgi:NAD-dependent dihydropyrimidine dehydrogenase PreA subunit
MAKHEYIKNVATLQLTDTACIHCGMCSEVCPQGVFEKKAGKIFIGNRDRCMECGACMVNCPVAAVTVKTGVGCAAAIIYGALKGTAPCCGGDDGSSCCG